MYRVFQVIASILLILILIGCGAGGGEQEATEPNPTYTLQIPPSVPNTQPVGNDLNITVPAGTFPQGSELTITLKPTGETPTNDFEIIAQNPILNISSSSPPQGNITITPIDRSTKSGDYLYFFLRKVDGKWDTINDIGTQAANSLDLVIDKTKFGLNGAKSEIQGLIGKIKIISVTDSTDMTLMTTDTSAPVNKVLVLVHGFNSNAEAMRFAANQIQSAYRYSRIYSFAYDWRRSGSSSAADLGIYLDAFFGDSQQVDILAHSWGVLVSRYALEKLGKTHAVYSFYAVCGPHEGTILASPTELIRLLRKDYLNKPGSDQPFGLAAFDTPAANDMVPHSNFLNSLNHTSVTERGHVNYCLFTALRDMIVPNSSSSAQNITLASYTSGTIENFAFNYDHSGLVLTAGGITDLLGIISRRKDVYVQVDISPQNVDAERDGWNYTGNITNLGTTTVYTQNLSIDCYDRDGDWQGIAWYDPDTPPGEFFPGQYQSWQRTISPGETISIAFHTWTDSERHTIFDTAENNKAKTVAIRLKYQDNNGMQIETIDQGFLHFGDIWPDQPHARLYTKNNGLGNFISPGK